MKEEEERNFVVTSDQLEEPSKSQGRTCKSALEFRSPNGQSELVNCQSRPGEAGLDSDEADLSLSSIEIIDEPITNLAMFDRRLDGSREIRSVVKRSLNPTGHSSN